MTKDMYDIVESCLQELENGVEIENMLSRFPDLEGDLRPILNAALKARNMTAPAPSQAAVIRGRARLMQAVSEMREEKSAPRKRAIPFFQRIAITIVATATLLLSGTGLVGASSSALPGQNLYPVKRGWEDIRLFLTFNKEGRNSLEREFDQERLHEVDALLSDEERLVVDFSGVFAITNGKTYVSNVQVLFPAGAQLPQEGAALHITGSTTEKGYVEITSFEILPDSSSIPSGQIIMPPLPSNTDGNENGGDGDD